MTQYSLDDGGTVTITSVATGDASSPYQFTIQKYDATGAPVGAADQFTGGSIADFDALSNGGYVVTEGQDASSFSEGVFLFGPQGGASPTAIGLGLNRVQVASSPQGGFLVEDQPAQPHGLPDDRTHLALYDDSGAVVGRGTLYGAAAPIGLDGQGDYVLQSNAVGPTTLVVAPGDPSSLQGPPAPTIIGAYDDVGSSQGWLPFTTSAYSSDLVATRSTDDPQLTFRVGVSQVETLTYFLGWGSGGWAENHVTVTAQDVANGYVDIPMTASNGVAPPANTSLFVNFAAVDSQTGVVGGATPSFHWTEGPDPGAFSITGPGAETLAPGGTTDFAFTVTRSGDLSTAGAVDYYQAYGGTAASSDFASATAGTVYFQPGQSTGVIHIAVDGSAGSEADPTFTIALANPRGGTIDANAGSAAATIDTAAGPPAGAIPLADGGYVVVTATSANDSSVQKYDAQGATVGGAFSAAYLHGVTALSNGGYIVLSGEDGPYAADVHLFDAAATQTDQFMVGGFTGSANVAASPDGGFLIASQWFTGHQDAPDPTLTLYDNSGNALATATYEYGADPAVSVDGSGRYVVSRSDLAPLTVDPTDPAAAFHPPAAISGQIVGMDDSGPLVRQFGQGAFTDDHTPTLRIPVQQAGGLEIAYTGADSFSGRQLLEVPVSDADVANGYVDVTLTNVANDATQVAVEVSPVSAGGLVGPATTFSFNEEPSYPVAYAQEVVDHVNGVTSVGRPIQDANPEVQVVVSNQQIGETIQLFDNGVAVSDPLLLTAAMLPRAENEISLYPTLVQGNNALVVHSDDGQGNVVDSTALNIPVEAIYAITGPGSVALGADGTADFAFTVTRGDTAAAGAGHYYLAYGGTADSSDFAGPTAGTVYFQPGQSTGVIHIAVDGDTGSTSNPDFTIALANARGGGHRRQRSIGSQQRHGHHRQRRRLGRRLDSRRELHRP